MLEEYVDGAAYLLCVKVSGQLGAEANDGCAALGGGGWVYGVRHPARRGAFPFRILEDMRVEKRCALEEIVRLLEMCVRLAGESDHDVRSDADIGDGVGGLVDELV